MLQVNKRMRCNIISIKVKKIQNKKKGSDTRQLKDKNKDKKN